MINSTLCPPSHCHSFTFSIPKHDTLAAVARTRLQSSLSGGNKNGNYQNLLQPEPDTDLDPSQSTTYIDTAVDSKRNMSTSAELVFHGVTLTIYTPAEKDRSYYLKKLKERRERAQNGQMGDSLRSRPRTPVPPAGAQLRAQTDRPAQKGKSRAAMPWGVARKASVGEYSASDTEGAMSDSDFESVGVGRSSAVGSAGDEALVDDGGDVFWLPYAVTIGEVEHTLMSRADASVPAPHLRLPARLSPPHGECGPWLAEWRTGLMIVGAILEERKAAHGVSGTCPPGLNCGLSRDYTTKLTQATSRVSSTSTPHGPVRRTAST